MGHSEITQAPCQSGAYGYEAIAGAFSSEDICGICKAEISVNGTCVAPYSVPAAGNAYAEGKYNRKGYCHYYALYKVSYGNRQKAAKDGVNDYNCGADYHCCCIIKAQKAVEKLADSRETGGGIRYEENYDNSRRQA